MPRADERRTSTIIPTGPRNASAPYPMPNPGMLRPQSKVVNMQAPTSHPTPPTAPAAWTGGGVSTFGRSTAGRSSYNPGLSRVPPTAHTASRAMTGVTGHIGEFNIGAASQVSIQFPAQAAYDPSEGPSPSMAPINLRSGSMASSTMTTGSARPVPVNNNLYVVSGKKRSDFRQGEIIAVPYHTANTNPNTSPNDQRVSQTWLGPTYTKRRMMVILWIFQESMLCLPLYSFSGRGLSAKPPHMQKEYVCMKNVGDGHFVNDGQYEPVEVRCRIKPMTAQTTVQLTGGVKVSFDERSTHVGRLTKDSWEHLVELWQDRAEEAHSQGF